MNSNQEEIRSERIDDIPMIVELVRQMEIRELIDQELKEPHGNHHPVPVPKILQEFVLKYHHLSKPSAQLYPPSQATAHLRPNIVVT